MGIFSTSIIFIIFNKSIKSRKKVPNFTNFYNFFQFSDPYKFHNAPNYTFKKGRLYGLSREFFYSLMLKTFVFLKSRPSECQA